MMIEKIRSFLWEYVRTVIYLVLLFILIRILEYSFIYITGDVSLTRNLFFESSINYDTLFVLLFSACLLIPLFLLNLINFKFFSYANRSIAMLLILTNLALVQFFLITGSLLTSQVFEFSFTDLSAVVFSEFSFSRFPLWVAFILATLLSFYVLFKWIKQPRVQFQKAAFLIYGIALLIAIQNIPFTYKELKHFDSNYQYQLGNSKLIYLIKSYILSKEIESQDVFASPAYLGKMVQLYQRSQSGFTFEGNEFPLIHQEVYQNVLGANFISASIMPNVVIIIAESLSSVISGSEAPYGSLTPFTDSLSNQGLSWQYFLSNAERSFGALPNILASAPPGVEARGFINTTVKYADLKRYPKHLSLVQLLKDNGYTTNYYYGGWGEFDHVSYYLKENKIDHFVSERQFNTSRYHKKKESSPNQVWGYADKDLFSQSMDFFAQHCQQGPFLSIYQTISNHSPYNLSDDSYYEESYLNKRLAALSLSPNIQKIIDKNIIASVLYSDDALRDYFSSIAKNPAFNNTIFIITGDHSLGLNTDTSVFKNYWVPLIIYSPLLKHAQRYKGVSSHIDILPSLLALLQQNFNCQFPQRKHWIGAGLDTSTSFHSSNIIPLNLFSLDKPAFIIANHVLYSDNVYRFKNDFTIELETDAEQVKSFAEKVEAFRYLNNYVCRKNKIW